MQSGKTQIPHSVSLKDPAKLVLLEKLSKFLTKYKIVKMVKRQLWEEFANINYEYVETVSNKEPELTGDEKRYNKLSMLKTKRKISKKQEKEMKTLAKQLKKQAEKKNDNKDKQLKKTVRKELKETSAVVASKKTRGTARQILLKIFYISFKVLREYPLTQGFDSCIKAIERNCLKAAPSFLTSVLGELKTAFDFFSNEDLKYKGNKVGKQLLILHAIIRISTERSKLNRRWLGYRRVLQFKLFLQGIEDSPNTKQD